MARPFAEWPAAAQWAALAFGSASLAGLMEAACLPAALLLGPMLAAVAAGVNGATVRLPPMAHRAAQGVVGVLVAASIEPEIGGFLVADGPLILFVVFATVAASGALGVLLSRWRVLPGTTGVWGSVPGAATAMVLMAEAFGADARLVAVMQYLRVMMVSAAAALVATLWAGGSNPPGPGVEAVFPPIEPIAFGATLAAAFGGALLGRLVRLPAPFFLGPAMVGAALHLGWGQAFQLPPWLLGLSYAAVGWSVGLNFTRPVLGHALRALPRLVAAILVLMALCGGASLVLVRAVGVDPLTAYLATSPGGMDSVAIIAAASGRVDLSFVMALQSARFLFVLLFGPALARRLAARAGRTI